MSVEQPDALALLDIARATLLEQVLPELDGDARYQALMIASAMAMAMRELNPATVNGREQRESEAQSLRELYEHLQRPGNEIDDEEENDGAHRVQRREARFVRDLRNGELDAVPQHLLRQLLRERIEARLAVSNPRRLSTPNRAPSASTHPPGGETAPETAPETVPETGARNRW